MNVKSNSTETIDFAKEKIQHGIYIMKAALHDLILKVLGAYSRDKTCGTLSPDGRYAISWSWKGLIYLIDLGGLGPPIVIGFVVDSCRSKGIWEASFSKDMQQISVTHRLGDRTILSAVPVEGFHRRQLPIVQDWSGAASKFPPRNIVEFITKTSSAYWKHIDDPSAKTRWKLPTPFTPPPPTELDCDWEQWVSNGERFLDIPRDTCELEG